MNRSSFFIFQKYGKFWVFNRPCHLAWISYFWGVVQRISLLRSGINLHECSHWCHFIKYIKTIFNLVFLKLNQHKTLHMYIPNYQCADFVRERFWEFFCNFCDILIRLQLTYSSFNWLFLFAIDIWCLQLSLLKAHDSLEYKWIGKIYRFFFLKILPIDL